MSSYTNTFSDTFKIKIIIIIDHVYLPWIIIILPMAYYEHRNVLICSE